MNDDRRWLERINSPDVRTRLEAVGELLFDTETNKPLMDRLIYFFESRLPPSEKGEDFFQTTAERVVNKWRHVPFPVEHHKQLTAYVWRVANNLVKDHYRKMKGYSISLEPLHEAISNEDVSDSLLQHPWYRDRLRILIPHLPDEETHLTMILMMAGYNFRQISWLVPWSIRKVQRQYQDSKLLLQSHYSIEPEYLIKPKRWDHVLFFDDDSGHLGLAFTEAQPKNFAGETARTLCQILGLKNIEQLQSTYRPLLVIQDIYSNHPAVQLAFSNRNGMNLNTLLGSPLPYLGGTPIFESEGKGQPQRLHLKDLTAYQANVATSVKDLEAEPEYLDWLYDIDGVKFQVRKKFNKEEFYLGNRAGQPLNYFRALLLA